MAGRERQREDLVHEPRGTCLVPHREVIVRPSWPLPIAWKPLDGILARRS